MTQPNIPFRDRPGDGDGDTPEPTLRDVLGAVSELADRVSGVNDRLTALETPPTQKPTQPEPEPEDDFTLPSNDEWASSPNEPAARIAKREAERVFAERGNPVAQTAVATAIRLHEADLKEKYGKEVEIIAEEWAKHKQEVLDYNPQLLAHVFPNGQSGVERAFLQIRGQCFQKLHEALLENEEPTKSESPRRKAPFIEPARPRAGDKVPKSGRLSNEQREVAARMGISDEEYFDAMQDSEVTTPQVETT